MIKILLDHIIYIYRYNEIQTNQLVPSLRFEAKRVLFGRSIGATCAVHLAANKARKVHGLVVDSGLMSIKQLPTVQMWPGENELCQKIDLEQFVTNVHTVWTRFGTCSEDWSSTMLCFSLIWLLNKVKWSCTQEDFMTLKKKKKRPGCFPWKGVICLIHIMRTPKKGDDFTCHAAGLQNN